MRNCFLEMGPNAAKRSMGIRARVTVAAVPLLAVFSTGRNAPPPLLFFVVIFVVNFALLRLCVNVFPLQKFLEEAMFEGDGLVI